MPCGSAFSEALPGTAHPEVTRHSQQVPGLDAEESLAEFRELVTSAGGLVAAEVMQRRARPDPATLIGAGKVEEIAGIAASVNADLVLFDHDLTPTQLRNLEAALPCRVLDRTHSSSTSLRATHAPARASCRWSLRSSNTCCHGSAGKPRYCNLECK